MALGAPSSAAKAAAARAPGAANTANADPEDAAAYLAAGLKAALALSDRLVIVVGKDKSIIVEPTAGETKADAVTAFLK